MPSFGQRLEEIAAAFRECGAVAVLLIDASPLEGIESGYGLEAYRQSTMALRNLVSEALVDELGEDDRICLGDPGSDDLLVLLFRPRSDDGFYREGLPGLASRIGERVAQHGSRVFYPYRRDAGALSVGHSFSLYNPGLRAERQLRETIARARQDGALGAAIEARARARGLEDLVLSEDVTILYEPIVNLTTREVLGYEALVRGPHQSELYTPGALFQLAEQTGLVFELDCLCRRAALRGARGIPPGQMLFLNVLPTAIHDPSFRGDALRQNLDGLRLRPQDVVLEISERESIDNLDIFRETRDYYRDIGFKIALDDIGVAYGSLQSVMELSPDFIKVDLSLVRSIDTEEPRQELLRALHSVAGKMQSQVIAEGIETSEELATLQGLGIPYGQGFLIGRAAPLRRVS